MDIMVDDEEVDVVYGVDGDDDGSWCGWTCRWWRTPCPGPLWTWLEEAERWSQPLGYPSLAVKIKSQLEFYKLWLETGTIIAMASGKKGIKKFGKLVEIRYVFRQLMCVFYDCYIINRTISIVITFKWIYSCWPIPNNDKATYCSILRLAHDKKSI